MPSESLQLQLLTISSLDTVVHDPILLARPIQFSQEVLTAVMFLGLPSEYGPMKKELINADSLRSYWNTGMRITGT